MRRKTASKTEQLVQRLREQGFVRARDLGAWAIPREYLRRLCRSGVAERESRGLYRLASQDITEKHSLAETCKRVPRGVICLLSALRFHELTTQQPWEVWMAIDRKAWRPGPGGTSIRTFRFSGKALTEGVEEHVIEGVRVRVYNAAKTIAYCFKYRNKVGLDVAMETLQDCRQHRTCTNDELWHYAKLCRVAKVMRPYLEITA